MVNYFAESKRTVPDFLRNQELFGGDYWTRTSDLLRVKIRMDVKGLRLGVFRQFLPHFLQAQYLPSPLRPPAYFLILVKGPAPPDLAEPGLFMKLNNIVVSSLNRNDYQVTLSNSGNFLCAMPTPTNGEEVYKQDESYQKIYGH
ncbi:MAG: hypothetical protein V8R75_10650 [Oscillospiraceae bacterium]